MEYGEFITLTGELRRLCPIVEYETHKNPLTGSLMNEFISVERDGIEFTFMISHNHADDSGVYIRAGEKTIFARVREIFGMTVTDRYVSMHIFGNNWFVRWRIE